MPVTPSVRSARRPSLHPFTRCLGVLSVALALGGCGGSPGEPPPPPSPPPPPQATLLLFTTQPVGGAPGAALATPPTVRIADGSGTTIATSTAAVTLALGANPGGATLGGPATVNAVNGVATFPGLTVSAAGTGYTLVATSAGLTSATSAPFTVTATPAVPTQLVFETQPGGAAAGVALTPQPRVRIADASGATVAGSTLQVQLALQAVAGTGTLGGTASVAAVNGVATFGGLSVSAAGTYRLVASVTGQGGIAAATSTDVVIAAAGQARLEFGVQPGLETVGLGIAPAPTVRVLNADGTANTASTAAITLALGANPGSATLGGTLTRAAVGGVATFPGLTLSAAGTGYTLVATGPGLANATSTAFEARLPRLVFATQPGGAVAGQPLAPQPVVTIVDAENTAIAGLAAPVQLTLNQNGNAGTLGGTASLNTVNGVATFSGLAVGAAGAGYTLTASSTGRTSATSTAFTVTAAPPAGTAQLAAGNEFTMALKRDGTVWVWGRGQIGSGAATDNTLDPTRVLGLPAVRAIAAGRFHLLALAQDGRVFAWGVGTDGQLGLGATSVATTPQQVAGLANIVAISAHPEGDFSLALRNDGAVFAWGANGSGQLGDGTLTPRTAPVRLTAPALVNVTAIAAGGFHALARRADGTVVSWGEDLQGQLGDGAPAQNRATPAVIPGLTGVAAIAAGSQHSFALFADGRARGWGDGERGQHGDNAVGDALSATETGFVTTSSAIPTPASSIVTDFVALSAGNGFTLGLRANGQLLSWGNNAFGTLGNGASGGSASTSVAAPVAVTPATTVVRLASAGRQHALLARNADGRVQCWGSDREGQCGFRGTVGFESFVPANLFAPFTLDQ